MSARRGKVRAPELRGRGGWVNAPDELSVAAPRGKVVILDFWTFCCINCLHVLEELKPLEERFGDALVVVGVHSPKFEHEQDHDALVRAVARYGVQHPVLDDPDRETWDQYGIRAWPTLVLVDPEGYAVAALPGEGNSPALERAVERMIEDHREKGTLDERPVGLLPPTVPSGALRFPGKVATGPGGLLAVADSGHNRVVVARLAADGATIHGAAVEAVAGTGERGAGDGGFAEATFAGPQGLLFLDEYTLLVADTGNHLVRRLDLREWTVGTIAGNGSQARWGASGGSALRTALNSPWDLELWEGRVVVAMAGSHQLWSLGLDRGEVSVLAGNGVEELSDGPAEAATMAQPSGLSSDGERLWVSDSETSSLRYLDRAGDLRTVVGSGLFDFGHRDGPAPSALLQHPLGVVATPRGPVVCDTYNSSLRLFDPQRSEVETLTRDGLDEPSGAAALDDAPDLVVADTNNHRLVAVSPGGEVKPFGISGLAPPAPATKEGPPAVDLGPVELSDEVELSATLPVPGGEKLDPALGPPVQLSVSSEDLLPGEGVLVTGDELPARTRLSLAADVGTLDVLLRIGTCGEGPGAACTLTERRWRVAVHRDHDGSPRLNLGLGG
ncbi:MAG: redoxin domain-containing protein [Rubrobacter sp.]|nr:redoxin domain-containing protein [Rubrobacter sp.]